MTEQPIPYHLTAKAEPPEQPVPYGLTPEGEREAYEAGYAEYQAWAEAG